MHKKNFIELIDALRDQMDKDFKNYSLLSEVFNAHIIYDTGTMFFGIIKFLREELNDKSGWIEHYIYEMDFGRKGLRVWMDGKEIPLTTPEDLWNIVTHYKAEN